jgi:hypothetical protein
MPSLICPACYQPVDPSGSAVCGYQQDGEWHDWWAPFVEDLRTDPRRLMHARCYVSEYGLDALLALIYTSDDRQRSSASNMHAKIIDLEQRMNAHRRRP